MWTFDEREDAPGAPAAAAARPDCPGCGEPDLAGDDFCHECGHAFTHFRGADEVVREADRGAACPVCPSGELTALEYGRTQCDSCGYTTRDEG